MTIHLAAARPARFSHLVRVEPQVLASRAANDNGAPGLHDKVIRAALKHFAKHGLGAAEVARGNAERAYFAGDREIYDYWLSICRTLDRRMAAAIAARAERSAG